MPSTIYLARHATPDRFRPGFVYHQLPGPPLNLQGIQEAQLLGVYFLSVGVSHIFSSPFERCRHTTEIAAGVAGISSQVEDVLGELQPGETPENIFTRLEPAFERIYAHSLRNGPVAMLAHGGVVRVLLGHLGLDGEELARLKIFDYGNLLPPAGVWLAEQTSATQTWSLRLAFQPEALPLEL